MIFTELIPSRWFAVASALSLCGCSSRQVVEAPPAEPAASVESSSIAAAPAAQIARLAEPYPAGRWRLARPEQLYASLIWASQILIAHRDVTPGVGCFQLPDWTPRSQNPERSREAAFALADSLARQARAAPERFAELAGAYSEDVMSSATGGVLGGRPALDLTQWPEILDALEALTPGQVSRVVESEFGFHVLRRDAPPHEQRVSGARIVIGYDQAPWLHRHLARRAVPPRSRAAALELADAVYRRLVADPEELPRLVAQYSDHEDAMRGGDFGEWSTREATPFFQERAVLEQLAPGQAAPPIDSPFGVQIIVRTAERPRVTYAMTALALDFDRALPAEHPGSLEAVRRELTAAAPALRRTPSEFDARRARQCCAGVETWVQGRGHPAVEAVLEHLAPGELALEPVVVDTSRMALVRRVQARPEPLPPVSVELPRPTAPDREWLATTHGDAHLLGAVAERAGRELELDSAMAAALSRLAADTAPLGRADSAEARVEMFRAYEQRVRELLGPERFARYNDVFDRYLEERLLRVRPLGPFRDAATGLPYLGWPLL